MLTAHPAAASRQTHSGGSHQAPVATHPLASSLGQRRRLGHSGLSRQDAPQVVRQLLGRGIAFIAALGHALRTTVSRSLGMSGLTAAQPWRLLLIDGAQQFGSGRAGNRRLQCQQLVERHGQRIDVRAVINECRVSPDACSGLI